MEIIYSTNIKYLFFIIPVILFIHEMEEWNIYYYHKRTYSNRIQNETILSGRLWLIFLSMLGFIWIMIVYFIPGTITSSIIMMLLIDFTLLNSIQHIGLTIKTRKYNPGFIFGGIIGLVAAFFIIGLLVTRDVLPIWLIIILMCLIIPGLIDTIIRSKKNKLPKMVEWILVFSARIEKFLSE